MWEHLPEHGDESTGSESQDPRKPPDGRVWLAHNSLDGVGHLNAGLEPVSAEVEHFEGGKLCLAAQPTLSLQVGQYMARG